MILSDDNISFDIEIIKECMNEIDSNDIPDKKKYMDKLVAQRLEKCNNLYIEEYRKSMNKLLSYIEDDAVSINDIPKYMRKVSRNMKSLYATESAVYSIL